MAGIISNVAEDVRRLREVKAAIEDVKKSLKGIDIRVNLDIKESIEARLKALSEQYTALVMKIAKAEGKIKLSVHNINKASETINQAQEKISKVTGTTTQQPSATSTPSNTSAETASIQAQAKAYNDLRNEINDVLGTRDANVKRMVEEMNAIRLINVEIKRITKLQGESGTLSSTQQKRLEQLNNSLLTHKTALSDVRQVLSNNVRMDNAAETSMNGLSQSLSRMRIAYRELTEEERNSPIGKELLASINQADAKIKELDATIGNHQREVGNYGKKWNGLSMSVQQIVRELPAAKMGLNMFFLAISNNISILVDEINRAKMANEGLKASGQSSTPVWKQVASSLFSWQSAMMVGITLLTMYGKDIVNWVGSLFNASDALKETKRFQDALNQSMRDAVKDSSEETTKLNILYKAAINAKKSIEERTFSVRELKKEFPSYFGLMDDEKIKAGEAANAYKLLTENILASAKARRTEKLIISEQSKYLDYLGETTMALISVQKAQEKLNQSEAIYNKAKTDENKEIRDIDKKSLERKKEEYNKASNKSLQQKINIDNLVKTVSSSNLYGDPKKREEESIKNEDYWKQQVQIADSALKQIDSSQKKLMDAGKFNGIDATVVKNYKDNIKKLKEAEKELKVYDSSSKQESAAEKLRKETDKYNVLLSKQALEQKRSAEDLETQLAQTKIDSMSDGFLKEQKQRDLNNKKEIQALERQKEDYIRAVIQAEKEKFDANPQNKKKTFDSSTVKVDTSKLDTIIKNTETKQGLDEWEQREASMNEYLLKYGTFSQKKEAIDKKYQDAINKETDLGKKNTLQKEWEEAISSLNIDKLKQEINWELVFGDLSKASKKSLNEVKLQLKTFKDSDEYKNMAVDQKKVVDEALNNIQSAIIDKGGLLGDLPEQLEELRKAQEELDNAQKEYNETLKNGTDAEKEAALKKKNNAEKDVQNRQINVTKSADKTSQNLITLSDSITQLGSSSEMSLSQIGGIAEGITNIFTEAGSKIGGIVGAAFSLLDAIEKQGFDGFVENVFSGVFNAGASIWDTITFGAFSKITGIGDSDKNLERDLEYLAQSNQDLKNSLDNLSEKMDKASVADASDIYEVQKENIKKQEANTLEAMQRSGAASKDGFIFGGEHSSNYRINKGISTSEWNKISEIIGHSVKDAGQFFQLSSEEMAKLAEEDTSLYSKIKDLANNGYKDAAQYMDEYITYYKQLQELENAYNEKLTNTSFDSIRDDFKNMLLDMESDTEDFAKNFEKLMQNAIVESLMTKKYDKLIQDWYGSFAEAMKSGDTIDEDEQGALKDKWDKIVEQATAERDALKDAMGWESDSSSSQSSTSKGFEAMSQDTGEELNGRFTALQISGEEIKNQSIAQTQSLNLLTMKSEDILRVNSEIRNIADETRDLIANSYLELVQISENTGAIIKPIQQMQKDMAEVKKNTSKL